MAFQLVSGQHIHVVGIGGFGMSAIARVLLETGYTISGSDQKANALTASLEAAGAQIMIGHNAANVGSNVDVLLASSAIPSTNPEIETAYQRGIPVLHRRDAIGALTAPYQTLAVSGVHGKTTTTALLCHVLTEAGLDPTAIVGGVMNSTGTNACVGRSQWFVIEADEYGEMFLGLRPAVAIVNNIEHDHPDQFPTLAVMVDTFRRFIEQTEGVVVAGIDSPPVAELIHNRPDTLTYSLENLNADWAASDIQPHARGVTTFTLYHQGQSQGTVELSLMGKHNVENALAVIATAHHIGIPLSTIQTTLDTFQGTARRSQIMGRVGGVTLVNDYAHHPTAIRLTLEAWRGIEGQLWAVWQPHTYNRLRALADDFMHAFGDADHVLITDVYSVREEPTPGLSAPDLAERMPHPDARYSGGFEASASLLEQTVKAGDCVIIFSAGDAPRIGEILLERLQP
ncbi:MAG: UDP-N-acetylmuramate--L-alanine ligase [Anaerolineales bacterium]|nr:UDP-N-acetylmuramate--L-alanine ligase [Anaerolineales bacterium]